MEPEIRAVTGYEWNGRFYDTLSDAQRAWVYSELVQLAESFEELEYIPAWLEEQAYQLAQYARVVCEIERLPPRDDYVRVDIVDIATVNQEKVIARALANMLLEAMLQCEKVVKFDLIPGQTRGYKGFRAGLVHTVLDEPQFVYSAAQQLAELHAKHQLEVDIDF